MTCDDQRSCNTGFVNWSFFPAGSVSCVDERSCNARRRRGRQPGWAARRDAAVSFFPIVGHALDGNADKGVFHYRMLADFETVSEITPRLLREFG